MVIDISVPLGSFAGVVAGPVSFDIVAPAKNIVYLQIDDDLNYEV